MPKQSLSVIGLGKLGACLAACFSVKGFKVLGMDINKNMVDLINSGQAPVIEPKLQGLIKLSGKRLRATQNYHDVILNSEISFLITPTPSRSDGHFSDVYLKKALKQLSLALKESRKKYHVFVIVSTISPGTIEKSLIPYIEKYSGRKLNKGFGLAYNPEFIALGEVINGLLRPDLLLVGQSSEFVGNQLEKIYKKVCENRPFVARMSLASAEIAKISLNVYVTMKISFANSLANICQRVPGSNIDDITRALGSDKRISPYYLKAGPAFGGPCFSRDNRAFIAFAQKYGSQAKLARATDAINEFQTSHLINKTLGYISKNKTKAVAVLGLAYKPLTPVIEESPGIKIIEELLKKKIKVIVFDPLAMKNTRKVFGDRIDYASSAKECFKKADFCIITTQEKQFQQIDKNYLVHNPTTIIDCWRMLDQKKLGKKAIYFGLGNFIYGTDKKN